MNNAHFQPKQNKCPYQQKWGKKEGGIERAQFATGSNFSPLFTVTPADLLLSPLILKKETINLKKTTGPPHVPGLGRKKTLKIPPLVS